MITLYSGTPGSGKSLHVAEKIWYALRYGRDVIANFDVNVEKVKKRKGNFFLVENWELSPDILQAYALQNGKKDRQGKILEGQFLLVIDECQILFNSRERSKDRLVWCTFFSQHRKYGYDVVLIAQFDRMIDRQIRCLIEYNIVHRNVRNYGWKGFILSMFFGGKLFVAVKIWYGLNEKTSSEFFLFRKRYARLYDSYKIFADKGGKGALGSSRRGTKGGPAADDLSALEGT